MKTLGLVMIVKNEERCLRRCLEAIRPLVDKIYITDTGSTDETVKIAQDFEASISYFQWGDDFAAARNFALEQSDCDWNIVLDADEYLVKGTREELSSFLEDQSHIGAIQLKDYFYETQPDIKMENTADIVLDDIPGVSHAYTWVSRVFPGSIRYTGKIHEQPDTSLPLISLPLVFQHDGYLQAGKGQRNLTILLNELASAPSDSYVLYQIGRTLYNLKRYDEACKYFDDFYSNVPDKGAGYRSDGIVLYIYSLLNSGDFDSALALVDAEQENLWELADFHFVCGMLFMEAILSDTEKYIDYLPFIEKSYQTCLEIGEVPEHQGVRGCGSFKAAYNLGVWYEVAGDREKAVRYYKMSAADKYAPAEERLKGLLQ